MKENKENYVWGWMLTRCTVVIISQYTQILNHYAVYLKLLYLKKERKKKVILSSYYTGTL